MRCPNKNCNGNLKEAEVLKGDDILQCDECGQPVDKTNKTMNLETDEVYHYRSIYQFLADEDMKEEFQHIYGEIEDEDEILNKIPSDTEAIRNLVQKYWGGEYIVEGKTNRSATRSYIEVQKLKNPYMQLSDLKSNDANIYAENHDAFCYIWKIQGTEHIYTISFTPQGNNALTATVERRTLEDKLDELKNQNYKILRKET